MAGYLEFDVRGGMKAYVEPSAIRAFLISGGDAGTVAAPDAPLKIVLASGDEFETFGTSIAEVMLRISALKEHLKKGDAYGPYECGISFADGGMSGVSKGLGGPIGGDDDRRAPQAL